MSRYNEFDYDEWEEYDDMYWGNDDDIDPYDQYLAHNGLDWDDDTSQDDYYDDAPLTWVDRLQNKWYWLVWRIEYFWDYTLNMHRCPDCKKIYRFGDHSDCIPF